jgi:beta-glucosidase
MECQKEKCGRNVALTLQSREWLGKGWQKVYVPLSCFVHEGDNFSATTMQFALEVGGAGDVSLANIKLISNKPADAILQSCPDYKTQSVTPDLLNEWWSIDWWLPRHQQKLADAKAICYLSAIQLPRLGKKKALQPGKNIMNHEMVLP